MIYADQRRASGAGDCSGRRLHQRFQSFDAVARCDVNIYSSLAAAASNLTGDVYHVSVAAPKVRADLGAFMITGPSQSSTVATANVLIPIDFNLSAGT